MRRRTMLLAAASSALLFGALGVACTDDAGDAGRAGASSEAAYDLPFGLTQPDGVVPVGRPAVYDHEPFTFNGVPVTVRSLRAAYRVTDPDPVGAVTAWLAELDTLALDEIRLRAAAASGSGPVERQPWIQATGAITDESALDGDRLDVQLWATGDDPILLVSVDRHSELPARQPAIVDEANHPPEPPPAVEDAEHFAGADLFAEQGDVVHLPEGTWTLMPTLPTRSGTGGSTSVLAADDGDTAVRDLLAEAERLDQSGEVREPAAAEVDGTHVVHAGFVISAGGWSFDVVAVRAPGDGYATVYVTSSAD